MEQHPEESCKSECRKDDPYGYRTLAEAMDQARLTTDGIHFDSIEGQAWLNRVFQERLEELEVELLDTGVLKEEGVSNEPTSGCHEDAERSTVIGQLNVLDSRSGLVDSGWHKLQLYNCLEVCRPRRTAL